MVQKSKKKTVKNTISISHIGNRSVLLSVRQNAVRTSLVQSGSDYAGLPRISTSFCRNYAR